jgi:hypothetical protein
VHLHRGLKWSVNAPSTGKTVLTLFLCRPVLTPATSFDIGLLCVVVLSIDRALLKEFVNIENALFDVRAAHHTIRATLPVLQQLDKEIFALEERQAPPFLRFFKHSRAKDRDKMIPFAIYLFERVLRLLLASCVCYSNQGERSYKKFPTFSLHPLLLEETIDTGCGMRRVLVILITFFTR